MRQSARAINQQLDEKQKKSIDSFRIRCRHNAAMPFSFAPDFRCPNAAPLHLFLRPSFRLYDSVWINHLLLRQRQHIYSDLLCALSWFIVDSIYFCHIYREPVKWFSHIQCYLWVLSIGGWFFLLSQSLSHLMNSFDFVVFFPSSVRINWMCYIERLTCSNCPNRALIVQSP